MSLETSTSVLEPMSLPWYRHKLVWMIIAIPAASVIAGINMIYLAVNTDDGLVVDDYYKEGMAINQSLQRDKTAAELGVAAKLNVEESGDMVRLHFNKGSLASYPEQLTLHLQHATQAEQDQLLQLIPAPGGQYIGYLKAPIKEGIWHIVLSTNEWRLIDRVRWLDGMNINLVAQ